MVSAGKMDVVVEASKPASASKKEKEDISTGKPKQYNDQCTAFVSNLSFKVSCLLVALYCFLKFLTLLELSG